MYKKLRHITNKDDNIFISLTYVENGTYIAQVVDNGSTDKNTSSHYTTSKDDQGALIYVCVVLVIYGFSIFFMIGSLIKKSMADHGVYSYMKNMDTLRRLERRQAKFKARMAIQNKKAKNNYRFDRAIFGGSGKSDLYDDANNFDIDASNTAQVNVMIDTISNESLQKINRQSSISLPILNSFENKCELFAKHRNNSTGCDFNNENYAEEHTALVPVYTIGNYGEILIPPEKIETDILSINSTNEVTIPIKDNCSSNDKSDDANEDTVVTVNNGLNNTQFTCKPSTGSTLQLQPLFEDEVATFL